jgi:hypothetical protein
MTAFNPDTFLDAQTKEAFTKRPPLPPGDYVGSIGALGNPRSGQQKKDPSKTWYALNVPIEIDTNQKPGLREQIGQDKVVLYDFVGLDLTDTGALDFAKGRNQQLRKYREALRMNTPGEPFAPRMMEGRTILVKVSQEPYQDEIRDTVAAVAPVS